MRASIVPAAYCSARAALPLVSSDDERICGNWQIYAYSISFDICFSLGILPQFRQLPARILFRFLMTLSAVTILSVGLTCKLFLRSGLCSVSVQGLDTFKSVIDDSDRLAVGQGIVTGALHESACFRTALLIDRQYPTTSRRAFESQAAQAHTF